MMLILCLIIRVHEVKNTLNVILEEKIHMFMSSGEELKHEYERSNFEHTEL